MGDDSSALRIVIVDDHEMVLAGLVAMFEAEEGITVVAQGRTARDAINLAAEHGPDVLILDIQLDTADDGLMAARTMRARSPGTKVVMLTAHAKADYVVSALMAGAAGFLVKRISGPELADAVRAVAAGELVYNTEMTDHVFATLRADALAAEDPKLATLSTREMEILRLVAEGAPNGAIGRQLFLSEKTVKNHLTHLLAKLGVHNRAEAAAYYQRRAVR